MKRFIRKKRAYNYHQGFKYIFVATAVVIAISSILVTQILVKSMAEEERKKIEIWAESIQLMSSQTENLDADPDLFNAYDDLILKFIQGNTTIPLVLVNENDEVLLSHNIDLPEQDEQLFLAKKLRKFRGRNPPIELEFDDGTYQYVYYDDSTVLKRLTIFPYAQLGVVFVFIVISFLALINAKRAEQDKVWIGLSKETAHQLGTPISSLMAWVEYLKTKDVDSSLLSEMDKDVHRLNIIAERFSKVGSDPEPEPMDVNEAIRSSVDYMSHRISKKISIDCRFPDTPFLVMMNESLFGWVIENLLKNAVDAMNGKGEIILEVEECPKVIRIDVSDTGKGIHKSRFEMVFNPGYTTKKRGWGLGLSLVRRIVTSYKRGRIYVLHSELNKGTTFRIELPRYSDK